MLNLGLMFPFYYRLGVWRNDLGNPVGVDFNKFWAKSARPVSATSRFRRSKLHLCDQPSCVGILLLAHFRAGVENEVRMIREFSAGALVLRHMQQKWYVAVIEPGRDGEPEDRRNVVALPKGNIDADETPEQAAVREVLEETGIEARPVAGLGSIRYIYSRKWKDGKKIFKVVTFHLMKYHAGRIGEITPEMQHEVRRAWWMPLRIAPTRLSYEGEREMARKAVVYVKSHPREF